MEYEVKINEFEGPLDLLLHLVKIFYILLFLNFLLKEIPQVVHRRQKEKACLFRQAFQ